MGTESGGGICLDSQLLSLALWFAFAFPFFGCNTPQTNEKKILNIHQSSAVLSVTFKILINGHPFGMVSHFVELYTTFNDYLLNPVVCTYYLKISI
jgi:hypothetical protein